MMTKTQEKPKKRHTRFFCSSRTAVRTFLKREDDDDDVTASESHLHREFHLVVGRDEDSMHKTGSLMKLIQRLKSLV